MSVFSEPKVADVEELSRFIYKISLHVQQPDPSTIIDGRAGLRTLNRWIYVGSIGEWILIDGSNIAPPEHVELMDKEAKKRIFLIKYSKWINDKDKLEVKRREESKESFLAARKKLREEKRSKLTSIGEVTSQEQRRKMIQERRKLKDQNE